MYDPKMMELAISLAREGKNKKGGGPFGAVITKNNKIIAQTHNEVAWTKDCTQHAELRCIQKACNQLQSKNLSECILYTSCVPCMMCLGAVKWGKFKQVYYGASMEAAKEAGFVYSDMYYSRAPEARDAEFRMEQKMSAEAVAVWNED